MKVFIDDFMLWLEGTDWKTCDSPLNVLDEVERKWLIANADTRVQLTCTLEPATDEERTETWTPVTDRYEHKFELCGINYKFRNVNCYYELYPGDAGRPSKLVYAIDLEPTSDVDLIHLDTVAKVRLVRLERSKPPAYWLRSANS